MRRAAAPILLLALAAGCQNPIGGQLTYGNQYREQGIQRYNAGDYSQAAGAFDEAVSQNPGDYRNHYWQGEAALRLGRHQQAVQSLDTALRVRELTAEGREDLATRDNIAAALGEAAAKSPGNAEINDLLTLAQSSDDPDVWLALAEAHRARGDADNAIPAYEQAYAAAPRDANIAKRYGLYLQDLDQPEMAKPALIQAYALRPEDQEVVSALESVGVVPGPSLRPKDELASPLLPKGPIPEFKINAGFEDNRDKPVNLDAVRERYEEPQ